MTSEHSAAPFLSGHLGERLIAPLGRDALVARTWFAVSLAAILLVHGSLLAFLLSRDAVHPQQVAERETPVEVVVEPPQNAAEPKAPEPEAKPEIEKPAISAPRAPTDDEVDTASLQKETRAPKALTPPKDGKPEAAEESASPSDDVAEPENPTEAANQPDVLQRDAEALDTIKPLPPRRPAKEIAKSIPRAKVRRAKTAAEQIAGASPLPDYSFAKPTKKSPVYGGNEDSRYLAIVYGMILAHRPRLGLRGEAASVTLTFDVEDDGRLVGTAVERSSGNPNIDAAAAAAIRRAAPFPPPPAGAPHSLIATIDFREDAPVYTMDREDR